MNHHHTYGEGRGCEGCRQATIAVYLSIWRGLVSCWPLVAVLGVWSVLYAVLTA